MSEAVVAKAVRRLQEAVERGSAYEGLQSAKSVYHRCRSRRQYEASYNLAQQGAQVLLTHGDITAGVELAKMLTEAYVSDNVPAGSEATQRLLSILDAAQRFASSQPPAADLSQPGPIDAACQQLAVAGIKWARGQEGGSQEAQRLHTRMGELIWSCRGWHGLAAAAEHYTRGADLTAYAAVLAACIQESGAQTEEESWHLCHFGERNHESFSIKTLLRALPLTQKLELSLRPYLACEQL
ncbi:hypothetical protein WJX84_001369 [Apatococcus fuscideae]|uniref:Uncharacterized protein n=1 Tax=Apatococcus fuscideae TaxID=2026836 RepID=A0AAW1SKT1_9CHLO